MLQLQHAKGHSEILIHNTQAALVALAPAGILTTEDAVRLGDAYRFLRRVESGLRLLAAAARHDLPSDTEQLGRLALLRPMNRPPPS